MTVTVEVLRQWEPAALGGPGADLSAGADTLDDLAASVRRAAEAVAWRSRAGEASRTASQDLARALQAVAAALRLQGEVLRRARGALEAAQHLLGRASALAAEHGLHLLPDGSVTRPAPVLTSGDAAPEVLRAIAVQQQAAAEARRRAEAMAREALASAAECDADAARALLSGDHLGRLLAGVAPGALGLLSCALPGSALLELLGTGLLAQVDGRRPPGAGSDPYRVAAWWASLPSGVQADLLRDHPDVLGGLDGLPAVVRDAANRARLARDRAALRRRIDRLAPDDPALGGLRRTLATLDAVSAVVALPRRRLLALDLSGRLATAVVAVGDVDTAAHVAVLTPGFTTTVPGDLAGLDRRMDALRRQAQSLSDRAGGGAVATVSWLGYEAPQGGWDLLRPSRSVAHDEAARRGAERLSGFYAGLDASRSTPVHLTALGHSYGSLVTGHALRPGTPVDDVVFFGSPGIGTSDVRDLGLQPGRVHVVEARRDAVADLAAFGVDPNQLNGVTGLSAGAAVVDGRRLQESTGHSSYLAADTTSQYAMAAVVAGRPELAPRDTGRGVGDWLQSPPPAWLRR